MSLGWFQALLGSRVGYDTDYQAILDRDTILGYTQPSLAKKTIENAAMIAIKAVFGVSSIASAPILQGLMFKTDGDSDHATLNWVNPAIRQATKINSPTFTSDLGFNSNGSTSYLTSGLITLDLNQADFSIAVRGYTDTGLNGELITGAGDTLPNGAESVSINTRNASNLLGYRAMGGALVNSVANTDGIARIIFGRTDASNVHSSINGAAFVSSADVANEAEVSRDITILAYNGSSGITNYYTRGVSYRWVFSRKLTDAEAAGFDAAIVNYLA